jgi:hypothetical protein
MRFVSVSFALLLTPAFALAQSAWQPRDLSAAQIEARMKQSSATVARLSRLTQGCPVGLQAQRQGAANMVTINGRPQREAGPSVRLTVINPQGRDIVGATVVVRGYDSRPRFFPVLGNGPATTMKKTVTLKLNVGGGDNGATNLTMKNFGSIASIDLESLEYADGFTWHASVEQPCTVEPDLLLLVADK